MFILLQMHYIMTWFKSKNTLSNGKWGLTQTQGNKPKKLFLVQKLSYLSLRFNNNIVLQTLYQKHLGIFLDASLAFEEHLKVITIKVNKTKGLEIAKTFQRPVLMTLYKAFVRPLLGYGDVIYDEANNRAFHQKLESIQYNACLALSGAIRLEDRQKKKL